MRLLLLISSFSISIYCFGQHRDIADGYVTVQYTKTINDLTKGNNPWGIGTGLQVFFNTSKLFRPLAEVTGDIYLEDDKTLLLGPNGEAIPAISTISKILLGPSLQLGNFTNVAVAAGASFTGMDIYLTLKPSLHIFLNNSQSVFFKIAYIHVYDRGNVIKQDFTSWSTGFGLKVF